MGIVRQLLQASSCYSIDLYQPYNGKYHWILWHVLWNSSWWFEMHVCWPGIFIIGWWCVQQWGLQPRFGWWNQHCQHGGLTTMEEDNHFDNLNVLEGSFTPMDWALPYLHETMAKITVKCKVDASIELCDHATSLLQRVRSNIHWIHLALINESMHQQMVFHQVDDGFKNSINWMKNEHKTMMEHLDTHKKRTRE
jgi:hypothetical protein